MNWIDILLIAVFAIALWNGWQNGFVAGSLTLLTWFGSFIAAFHFYPYAARMLGKWWVSSGPWLLPVAFLSVLAISGLVLSFIASRVNRSLPNQAARHGINRLLGLVPGFITGWLFAVIISALLLGLPLNDGLTQATRNSTLAPQLGVQSEWANKKLAPVFDEAVRHTMNSLTVHPKSEETVKLHFTYDNPKTAPELEKQMLEMINEEREKEGLPLLKADPELQVVARAHSKDMFARGYFAHLNPDGQSPFDRIRAANISFKTAGENLALAQTLRIAHINLMNSPGHRANILNPAFGRVGIGILDGGFYGLMISQEFRD